MAEAKKKEKWEDILDATRANYEATVKALTKMQEETEKVVSTLFKKGNELKDETAKIIKDWVEAGTKLRDDFQKSIEDNMKKSMDLIPDLKSMDFPFKKEFEDLAKKVQDNIQKAFSSFKV
jgi:polyhydroxyalkanoate synthesis regulator phasin